MCIRDSDISVSHRASKVRTKALNKESLCIDSFSRCDRPSCWNATPCTRIRRTPPIANQHQLRTDWTRWRVFLAIQKIGSELWNCRKIMRHALFFGYSRVNIRPCGICATLWCAVKRAARDRRNQFVGPMGTVSNEAATISSSLLLGHIDNSRLVSEFEIPLMSRIRCRA